MHYLRRQLQFVSSTADWTRVHPPLASGAAGQPACSLYRDEYDAQAGRKWLRHKRPCCSNAKWSGNADRLHKRRWHHMDARDMDKNCGGRCVTRVSRHIRQRCRLVILLALFAPYSSQQKDQGRKQLLNGHWDNAISAKDHGEWVRAAHYFAKVLKLNPDQDRRKISILNIYQLSKSPVLVSMFEDKDEIAGARHSNDGSLVILWDRDSTAKVRDARTGLLV